MNNQPIETYRINGVAVTKHSPEHKTDKAPIIMVHGGQHGSWGWENWARFFAQAGYEVHALNWYNHGDSDKLSEDEFLRRSIADVARKEITYVADQFERKPIIIGHSMGGLASAVYSAQTSVEKLVLIAPVMPAIVKPAPVPLPVDMSKPFPVFPYEQSKQFFFTTLGDSEAKHYYQFLVPESPRAVHEATRWTVEFDPTTINAPTLVLATEFDRLIPREALQRYAKMLHADYQQVDGIGHSDILLKEPEWRTTAQYTLEWLEKSKD